MWAVSSTAAAPGRLEACTAYERQYMYIGHAVQQLTRATAKHTRRPCNKCLMVPSYVLACDADGLKASIMMVQQNVMGHH
jgi:hypothetical protein